MNTRRHQVALYVASLEVSQDCLNRLQRIFDTSQDYPEIPPNPGYIHHIVEADTWANDLGLEEIYERHRREYYPTFYAKPIAVVDRRTSEDESVILIAPELGENGEFETKWFRIDSVKVVSAAMNLEISNQSVDDYSNTVYIDGIWRKFPDGTAFSEENLKEPSDADSQKEPGFKE